MVIVRSSGLLSTVLSCQIIFRNFILEYHLEGFGLQPSWSGSPERRPHPHMHSINPSRSSITAFAFALEPIEMLLNQFRPMKKTDIYFGVQRITAFTIEIYSAMRPCHHRYPVRFVLLVSGGRFSALVAEIIYIIHNKRHTLPLLSCRPQCNPPVVVFTYVSKPNSPANGIHLSFGKSTCEVWISWLAYISELWF